MPWLQPVLSVLAAVVIAFVVSAILSVVLRVIAKRVGPPVAAECLVDHSPPPPPREELVPVFRRDPGAGRPTKRDRRRLDQLRGRG